MDVHLLVCTPTPAAREDFAGLGIDGFSLTYTDTLADTVRHVVAAPPDAVLTHVDATPTAAEQCEILRALGDFPLIVTWHDAAPTVAAACLDRGADAAIALPLPTRELAARIRAVLRRAGEQSPPAVRPRVTSGDLSIDLDARTVSVRGREIELSPTEFQLLAVLAETPGRVVTNRELLTRIWGKEYADEVHYVRLYIGYLRSKLEEDPRAPRLILNQWGVGYRLVAEAE
jgi:two-component system, OmpR family, KDP operon response regulator KdpE